MAAAGTAALVSVLLNKWVVLIGAFMLIYLTGGLDVIFKNPTLLFFGIIVFIVTLGFGGKKR